MYVDDMLVKSMTFTTFEIYRKPLVSLVNTRKIYTPRSASSEWDQDFLGFMVTNRGIEVNPKKIQAIMDMKEPATLHDIQKLNGRLAALCRFLAKGI